MTQGLPVNGDHNVSDKLTSRDTLPEVLAAPAGGKPSLKPQ